MNKEFIDTNNNKSIKPNKRFQWMEDTAKPVETGFETALSNSTKQISI